MSATPPYPGQPLTPHELVILRAMADGLTDREIGRLVHLAGDTIKTHNRRIYAKLGVVSDRAAAVSAGYRQGLLDTGRACNCRVPAEERGVPLP